MPIEILMPALSPTMTKGKLIKWLVNAGDFVEIGQVIAEVETDKATMEVEAFDEGKIGEILVKAGTADVAVNSLIAVILLEGETENDIKNVGSVPETKKEDNKTIKDDQKVEIQQKEKHAIQEPEEEKRIKVSPVAKRLAKEKNVDLAQIEIGTGPYGRIVKEDVLNFSGTESGQVSEISTMRRVIAERLVASKQEIPHFYLSVDCNLSKLILLKQEIDEIKITINDFIIKATGLSLIDFPAVNSSWQEDKIQHYTQADVAVAVSLDEGLITPIVRGVDKKSLKTISVEIKSLAKKAKSGSLSSEEYQGGGITVSNLGMFGIKDFMAIINPPQSSILAVGAAVEKPIVAGGGIMVARMMSMTLSVDHRVVDGSLAAQFLNKIKYYLENPVNMLVL